MGHWGDLRIGAGSVHRPGSHLLLLLPLRRRRLPHVLRRRARRVRTPSFKKDHRLRLTSSPAKAQQYCTMSLLSRQAPSAGFLE